MTLRDTAYGLLIVAIAWLIWWLSQFVPAFPAGPVREDNGLYHSRQVPAEEQDESPACNYPQSFPVWASTSPAKL